LALRVAEDYANATGDADLMEDLARLVLVGMDIRRQEDRECPTRRQGQSNPCSQHGFSPLNQMPDLERLSTANSNARFGVWELEGRDRLAREWRP